MPRSRYFLQILFLRLLFKFTLNFQTDAINRLWGIGAVSCCAFIPPGAHVLCSEYSWDHLRGFTNHQARSQKVHKMWRKKIWLHLHQDCQGKSTLKCKCMTPMGIFFLLSFFLIKKKEKIKKKRSYLPAKWPAHARRFFRPAHIGPPKASKYRFQKKLDFADFFVYLAKPIFYEMYFISSYGFARLQLIFCAPLFFFVTGLWQHFLGGFHRDEGTNACSVPLPVLPSNLPVLIFIGNSALKEHSQMGF